MSNTTSHIPLKELQQNPSFAEVTLESLKNLSSDDLFDFAADTGCDIEPAVTDPKECISCWAYVLANVRYLAKVKEPDSRPRDLTNLDGKEL